MIRMLALAALAALTACSSDRNPIVSAMTDRLRPGDDGTARPGPQLLTRAQIDAAGVAAVLIRLQSDRSPTLLFGASANGGYVTFASRLRQSVTLRGSRITATRGLGTDLLSSAGSDSDPLLRPTPVVSWPERIERRYEFPAPGAQGRIETYECTFTAGAPRELEILEITYSGIEMTETCRNAERSFENLHFADARTGFVWRSLQWIGPDMDLIDLQVLEPYTGR